MGYIPGESIRNNSESVLYETVYYYRNSQNSLQSQRSSNCTTDSFDERIIQGLVEEMINDKFYGTLRRIKKKSMERRRSRINYSENTYEEVHGSKGSDDSGLNIPSLEDFTSNSCDSKRAQRIYETICDKSSRLSLGNIKSQTDSKLNDFRVSEPQIIFLFYGTAKKYIII